MTEPNGETEGLIAEAKVRVASIRKSADRSIYMERIAGLTERLANALEARAPQPASGDVAPQDRLSRHADIIVEALNEYDGWMKDDDFDVRGCLDRIIARMRDRYGAAAPPARDACSCGDVYGENPRCIKHGQGTKWAKANPDICELLSELTTLRAEKAALPHPSPDLECMREKIEAAVTRSPAMRDFGKVVSAAIASDVATDVLAVLPLSRLKEALDYFTDPSATVEQRVSRITNEDYPAFCNVRDERDSTKAKHHNASREDVFKAGVRAGVSRLALLPLSTDEPACPGCGTPISKGREYVAQGKAGCCPDMPGASSYVEFDGVKSHPQGKPADREPAGGGDASLFNECYLAMRDAMSVIDVDEGPGRKHSHALNALAKARVAIERRLQNGAG